jgi:hypothetical protein
MLLTSEYNWLLNVDREVYISLVQITGGTHPTEGGCRFSHVSTIRNAELLNYDLRKILHVQFREPISFSVRISSISNDLAVI